MLNENTIQEDIQEVLTTVLKMIDKEGVDDSGSFETIIREVARVTVKLYCHRKCITETFDDFSSILGDYKKNIDEVINNE